MSEPIKVVVVPGNGGCDVRSSNFYPYLVRELRDQCASDVTVVARNMPEPVEAPRKLWLPFMHNELKCDRNTIVVGHSSGAVAAMRFLEESELGGCVLVSAYTTSLGDASEQRSGYFDGEWQWRKQIANCRTQIVQFGSTDDPFLPIAEQDEVARMTCARYFRFTNKNHFMLAQVPELVSAVRNVVRQLRALNAADDDASNEENGKMTEQRMASVIERTASPHTVASLSTSLRAAVERFDARAVCVHASLRQLGFVAGGVAAVAKALRDTFATVLVPTHTALMSDPYNWRHPPVPASWVKPMRAAMLPFDRHTPSFSMSSLSEYFRNLDDAVRSTHPHVSFAGIGERARALCGDAVDVNNVADFYGAQSPLQRLANDEKGLILLLGVDYERCSLLHCAEVIAWQKEKGRAAVQHDGAPMCVDGQQQWVSFWTPCVDDSDFNQAGAAFERAQPQHVWRGLIGNCDAVLFDANAMLQFAAEWFVQNRVALSHLR